LQISQRKSEKPMLHNTLIFNLFDGDLLLIKSFTDQIFHPENELHSHENWHLPIFPE